MIFYKMELCQKRETINDDIYDLRRMRFLPNEPETYPINEQDDKSPIVHRKSVEYASDSSCEEYREFHKQPIERRNLSPIASSTFTIDSILGRNEKRDKGVRISSSGDKEEDQDETDDKIEEHFVRPTAMPATRSGMSYTK